MYKEYVAYLKDNPEGYWFRRKLYGWGWTPAKWQGWVAIGIYILALVTLFRDVDKSSHSGSDTLFGFALPFLVATIALLLLCLLKGERPRWQWGLPKKDAKGK